MKILRKYPISFLLPFTVIVNQLWEIWQQDCIQLQCDKFIHWSGKPGFVEMWHYWILFGMVSNILVLCGYLLYDKNNKIERDSLLSFAVWSILEMFAYLYNGWPSFKIEFLGVETNFTIIGYGATIITLTAMRLYNGNK